MISGFHVTMAPLFSRCLPISADANIHGDTSRLCHAEYVSTALDVYYLLRISTGLMRSPYLHKLPYAALAFSKAHTT
jgi:hypothetical protein